MLLDLEDQNICDNPTQVRPATLHPRRLPFSIANWTYGDELRHTGRPGSTVCPYAEREFRLCDPQHTPGVQQTNLPAHKGISRVAFIIDWLATTGQRLEAPEKEGENGTMTIKAVYIDLYHPGDRWM